MAGYQHKGPLIGECYGKRPTSPGVPDIQQFHGMLKDLINRSKKLPGNDRGAILRGLKMALYLFEGYFGYFGGKEEK